MAEYRKTIEPLTKGQLRVKTRAVSAINGDAQAYADKHWALMEQLFGFRVAQYPLQVVRGTLPDPEAEVVVTVGVVTEILDGTRG